MLTTFSPTGERITTLKALQAALGDKYDVTLFDWRSGKFMHNAVKHRSFNLTDAPGAKSKFLFFLCC